MSDPMAAVFDELLRSPEACARRSQTGEHQRTLVLCSIIAIAVGAGVFGGVLASSRGGLQLLYSAAKLPLALFATLVLVVPAFYALAACFGRALTLSGMVALSVAAAARAACVLVALSPGVWLAFDLGIGYHQGVLLAAAAYGLAGLAALRLIWSGFGKDARALLLIGSFGLVLAPTGSQTAWMLRPFLGRPADAEVPFFRHRESSFLDSVAKSTRSSLGIYDVLSSGERR